ncbi:hypothetical protein SXIM_52330 [Streptomyces xiamenensis]|uniref:Uncharacterized protein n=1 Tax=Streptomyces xiamenensis TaxID=408015 RepID=A0A0F7G0Q8_9ACTN|nr:hypothetical protein SXIM_52330 [Streptomyces xiamenensis]
MWSTARAVLSTTFRRRRASGQDVLSLDGSHPGSCRPGAARGAGRRITTARSAVPRGGRR